MKRHFFILALMFMGISNIIASVNEDHKKDNIATTEKRPATKPAVYKLNVYGDIPSVKPTFEEDHFIGEALKEKWNTFNANYNREYEVSIGFSDSGKEIIKPIIYNSVLKVNRYFKKEYKKGKLNKNSIIIELAHILDCSNILCMEEDTEKIEQELSNSSSPQQIADIFKRIELVRE